jgi:hypothetical protein
MADDAAGPGTGRRLLRAGTTVLAVLVVASVLVAPDRLVRYTPLAFLRIPVEGLVLVGLALLLPSRRARVVAGTIGAAIGLLAIVRVLDVGFQEALHRPVNPITDWRLVGPGLVTLRDSVGSGRADAAVIGAVLVIVAVPVVVAMSAIRICRAVARRRAVWGGGAGVLGVLWVVCALLGVQLVGSAPVASRSAADLAAQQVHDAVHNLRDLPEFRRELAAPDAWSTRPTADLLTGLRGKDVLVVFVESYGRVAVQGSSFAPGIDALLDDGTASLRAAGFSSRSGFLTSPTFAGISWLAHATLHSGLWVDSQQRHDQLLSSDRFSLPAAFRRAGWRTVVDVPSNRDTWPEGRKYYHYDVAYDRFDVGYQGPKFSFAAVPDQYSLAAFERRELAPGHAPVMAEIDLVSSHEPWTPLPHMLDWNQVGDGSVYDGMPAEGLAPADVLGHADQVQALYGESIRYSLSALISFVTTFHRQDDDLVVVLLGDHQPASIVSGPGASHDVPITILARDPAVMARTAAWGWDDGMLPGPDAPVWRMDAFRDRFLTAFGPVPRGVPLAEYTPAAAAPR